LILFVFVSLDYYNESLYSDFSNKEKKKMIRKLPKPRDPFVQHLVKKKQGPMGPTTKQVKKRDRIAFKASMKSEAYR
jgi:hypothetical protein